VKRQKAELEKQRAETEKQRVEAEKQKMIELLRAAGISEEDIQHKLKNN
jgi:DNA-binding transcriptional regulator YhcF (GntR family)